MSWLRTCPVKATIGTLSSRAGVPVGHVRRSLLVPGQNELDGRVVQGVEDRQHGPAGQAEHHLHALGPEHFVEYPRPAGARQVRQRLGIVFFVHVLPLRLGFSAGRAEKQTHTGRNAETVEESRMEAAAAQLRQSPELGPAS